MFRTHHHSPTNQTDEDPFKRIPFRIQAQQKLWRRNTPLHNAHTLLEKPIVCSNSVRLKFPLPSILYNRTSWHACKLLKLDENPRLILWTVYFLLHSSQTVHHQAALSSSRSISTGCPQGTVLSPVLFTPYANVCTGTDATRVTKYSDDSAIEGLFNSDYVYFAAVERFSYWCSDNSLDLSVKKRRRSADWF